MAAQPTDRPSTSSAHSNHRLLTEHQRKAAREEGCWHKALQGLKAWVGLLLKCLGAAFGAVFLAIGVVLYPIGYCMPPAVLRAIFKGLFKIGYTIYVFTPLGRVIHLNMVRSRRKAKTPPHTMHIPTSHLSSCDVLPMPILQDNYAFIITDRSTKQVAVVDPADPDQLIHILEQKKLSLSMVLTTHRHHDHAGGNHVLAERFPQCVFVGGKNDNCAATTKPVGDGDRLSFGGTNVQVLETPCHTGGHVVYLVYGYVQQEDGTTRERVEAIFSGDTLFIGGVGAFFHGGEKDMHKCINQTLAWLPDEALVFCGHEYTVENVRFAEWLEPGNMDVLTRANWAVKRRSNREPTVPRPIGEERRLNPFMRVRDPEFAQITELRLAKLEKTSGCWGSLFAGKKSEPYIKAEDNPAYEERVSSRHGSKSSNVEMGAWHASPSRRGSFDQTLVLLNDDEAIKVMKRLNRLMQFWSQSPEHAHQIPPCCLHGTCARRQTCSGNAHKGPVMRTQASQTDRANMVPGSPSFRDSPRRPALLASEINPIF
mmetsp:Transcript_9226/g.17268  ORF Transcript_9226/g.17268 Transcript_9226/m.17268 type:complete len:539 (-) Transcript_9226:406-2022(-)